MKTQDTGLPLILAIGVLTSFAHASDIKPSYLVPTNQIKEQIDALTPKLDASQRQLDPFGQLQVPQDQIIVHPHPPEGGRVKQMPFAQVVDRIPVAALMPKEKRVMIAGRTYEVGQVFPVDFKGRKVKVEVLKVTVDAVDFRNKDTGEVGTRNINMGAQLLKKEELRKDFAPEPIIELN